jgi:hypothetical protein
MRADGQREAQLSQWSEGRLKLLDPGEDGAVQRGLKDKGAGAGEGAGPQCRALFAARW